MSEIEFQKAAIRPVECLKEGWELIKPQYWIVFAVTLVGLIIASIIPFALGLGAMYCGIYLVIFKIMDGEEPEFGLLFKGFNYFVPALVATMAFILPTIVFTIISWISMVGFITTMSDSSGAIEPSSLFALYAVIIVEGVIFGLVLSCVHAFVMFTYPLIVEHDLSGFEAFKLSSKAVWQNLNVVVGFIVAEFVLGFLSYLACGVGLYFTLPIMFAGALVLYRQVFPKAETRKFTPPSPSEYGELQTQN